MSSIKLSVDALVLTITVKYTKMYTIFLYFKVKF